MLRMKTEEDEVAPTAARPPKRSSSDPAQIVVYVLGVLGVLEDEVYAALSEYSQPEAARAVRQVLCFHAAWRGVARPGPAWPGVARRGGEGGALWRRNLFPLLAVELYCAVL